MRATGRRKHKRSEHEGLEGARALRSSAAWHWDETHWFEILNIVVLSLAISLL